MTERTLSSDLGIFGGIGVDGDHQFQRTLGQAVGLDGPNVFSAPGENLAFNLTIQSVALLAGHRLTAGAVSFALTVNAVTFRTGWSMRAGTVNHFLTINDVDFLTGQPYLPPASAGLNYTLYVRESVQVKARSGEAIYNGSSTGTTLSSSDVGSILRLIATGRGKWFILNKTGNWTLA